MCTLTSLLFGPKSLFWGSTLGSTHFDTIVDARDFALTTAGVGDIVKASMTHRTKGKLVLTVSKQ